MTTPRPSSFRIFVVACLIAALCACSKKKDEATTASPAAGEPATQAAATAQPAAIPASTPVPAGAFTPEAMEELLAPIAIYPDVVLGHVLTASTNPQEVLDAGNWLLEHQDLTGSALDSAASKLGFSPSVRALLQFPETVDMMCMRMDWTTQLGQAFTADQAGVLDAIQRLRKQAQEVGNLQSSAQLAVATETQADKEVVTVKPADPEVVYVPKYDPVAVYAPAPASIPPPTTVPVATAPVTTTTTTTTTEDEGHSTGALITTGLLAFGAGILVNEVFDDDDDWDDYYPNYGHGGMYYGPRPYYPPPPYAYRPPYGGGFYPAHGYNRPANYQHGFNNNTIIVNKNDNYWNRYNPGSPRVNSQQARSPITAANPRRPELATLNQQAANRPRTAAQPGAARTDGDWKGQKGYAGAKPENRDARERMVQNSPRPTDRAAGARERPPGVAQDLPKRPQNTYAGATRDTTRNAARDTKPVAKPATRQTPRSAGNADRGRTASPDHSAARPELAQTRPDATDRPRPATSDRPASSPGPAARAAGGGGGAHNNAFDSGGRSAASERASSNRGRESMPKRAHDGKQRKR